MEKVRAWCGQPSDRGRLKNRTEQVSVSASSSVQCFDTIITVTEATHDPQKQPLVGKHSLLYADH